MTPEDHFRGLAEFVRGVELAGGTTPHVSMTVEMMDRLDDPLEKLWFAGCYALVYNWPTAERIWLEWRPEEVTYESFLRWTEQKWDGLALRKERKAVYGKPKFAECAVTYLGMAKRLVNADTWPSGYEDAFQLLGPVKYMGRYIGIRWVEVMRRAFNTDWEMPSILSDGGEHPRKALALLYPEEASDLLSGNSKRNLRIADIAADRCLVDMNLEYGVQTDYYELQSLLCEYKQSALGKKQYPGKSIDTEMDYFRRIYAYWGEAKAEASFFYSIREACFPEWSLGEKNGWSGVRKELGATLVDYGYTWSDAVYDWEASHGDLRNPQQWQYARPLLGASS